MYHQFQTTNFNLDVQLQVQLSICFEFIGILYHQALIYATS